MNDRVNRALSRDQAGDIIKYFEEMDGIIERNSGVNDNKTLQSDSSSPQCPVDNGTYTRLKITDDAIQVTNIDKSSITCHIDLQISWPKGFWREKVFDLESETLDEGKEWVKQARLYRDHFTKWFVGVKASSQWFDSYRVYSGNMKTACEQTEAIYENAVIRNLKPQEELDEKPHIYTTWEHAVNGDECVCGAYFTLADIKKAEAERRNYITVPIDACIPIDDFLPFSGFTMYPNCVFSNLSLEVKVGLRRNIIVCQVDPKVEFERLAKSRFTTTEAVSSVYNHLYGGIPLYTKSFTAMNDKFKSTIFKIDDDGIFEDVTDYLQFYAPKATMTSCRSNINGFNIKDSIMKQLQQKYENQSLIIPAQTCNYQPFSQKPSGSGINCNTVYGMTNVSTIIFMFPRTAHEVTISKNPHLSSMQAMIDNKPYPDKPFSSLCAEHSIFNITNAGLDSLFSPSREFSYSLNFNEMQKSIGFTEGDIHEAEIRNCVPIKDNTSYAFVVSTERLGGYGTYCDGITKANAHITLQGNLMGNQEENPYYTDLFSTHSCKCNCGCTNCTCCDGKKQYNDQAPIMVLVQDCFWEMRTGQPVQFVKDNQYAYEVMKGEQPPENYYG